ncbi:RNA-binding domain-containing protein [Dentipellis sp. KUC8613]|nr:RNA-binding domain-containing protein [Dentipellis sp. KUC8613]
MFIGGLNWDTTDESLRKYFTQFGKVDACTIMRDAAGRSRCFAFLTFEDPASVNAVMVREHFLDGKIIDPKRAIPRQEHQRATKLFIGGLAGSVTSESMREFFSQFGRVVDSTVMLDRETGRSKGFGFVSFEDTDVTPFLGFGNLEIDGKLIDVKLAQPRSQRDFESGQGAGRGVGGFGQGAGGYGHQGGQFGGGQGGAGAGMMGAQGAGAGGSTPFDPQALAALYTRMFAQMGGMNPMMGGMNPMMGGMGMGGAGGSAGAQGMGMGMGRGGAAGGGAGMGMTADPRVGGMGRGVPNGPAAGAGMGPGPNVPRGPRAAAGGGPQGVGPQRAGGRGQHQHGYHPYSR